MLNQNSWYWLTSQVWPVFWNVLIVCATGGRNAGIQIVAPVPTAWTAGIWVTPTE